MSKRIRNSQQKRAWQKREPFPVRAIGYMPRGPVDPAPATRLDDKHFERRRRCLRADEFDAA